MSSDALPCPHCHNRLGHRTGLLVDHSGTLHSLWQCPVCRGLFVPAEEVAETCPGYLLHDSPGYFAFSHRWAVDAHGPESVDPTGLSRRYPDTTLNQTPEVAP